MHAQDLFSPRNPTLACCRIYCGWCLLSVCSMCVLYDMNNWHSEGPDLFINVLHFISTVPAPQQASSSHHWPPTKTAFHSWSERFSAKLCPAWYPTPLLYPLTSTHSMPTSLEKERKFRATFCWRDVCACIYLWPFTCTFPHRDWSIHYIHFFPSWWLLQKSKSSEKDQGIPPNHTLHTQTHKTIYLRKYSH